MNDAGGGAGDITFRTAGHDDASLLAALNRQLILDENHRNTMSLAELEHRMRQFLDADYQATLIESVGQVVGYALCRNEAEHLYLRQFFIRPEFRRRGIGRLAVAWLKERAWRNHTRVRLDVLVTNPAAIAFWRSVGFSDYCLTMECERDRDDAP